MRFRTTALLLLGALTIANSAAAQTAPTPSAVTRTVLAAAKLPTVTDMPLYFRAVIVALPPGGTSGATAMNSILYQVSGSTELAVGGEAKTLNAGEGVFIDTGNMIVLKAGDAAPSIFLQFLLARTADLDPSSAVGPIDADTALVRHGALTMSDLDTIAAAGGVGMICARAYDERGAHRASDLDDRTLAISFEAFKRITKRWVVNQGIAKAPALCTEFAGAIVAACGTDSATARRILNA